MVIEETEKLLVPRHGMKNCTKRKTPRGKLFKLLEDGR
jgi:hypothetical protein